MYACVPETGRGLFEGACRYEARLHSSRDPPPPWYSRIDTGDTS
jgi:hypothetical protein